MGTRDHKLSQTTFFMFKVMSVDNYCSRIQYAWSISKFVRR